MSQIIDGADLEALFSVLHDGQILQADLSHGGLQIRIEIGYLAALIEPTYRVFEVALAGVRHLKFSTWPNDAAEPARVLTSATEIFGAPLQILSGERAGHRVKVVCNQPAPHFDFCGGELYFEADGAVVRDEAGREHSIASLQALADTYWSRWAERNAGGGAAAT